MESFLRTVNEVAVLTRLGECRSLRLIHGDLLDLAEPPGVLVCSATRADYDLFETLDPLELVGAPFLVTQLFARGVITPETRRSSRLRLEASLDTWISEKLDIVVAPRPRRVACLHGLDWENRPAAAFKRLFAGLSLIEHMGDSIGTVAMPLLGAGGMYLQPDAVAAALVDEVRGVLSRLETLTRVDIIERDGTAAQAVSDAMDARLSRPRLDLTSSRLFLAVRDDALQQVRALRVLDPDSLALDELEAAIAATPPSPAQIALGGRKLAERAVTAILARHRAPKKRQAEARDLAERIEFLGDFSVPRFVQSYLHVLRVFGNLAAHDGSGFELLRSDDLASALVCLVRVAEYLQVSAGAAGGTARAR